MKRVLLDEGVPKGLARRLRELGIDTTPFPNDWKQLSNGRLLTRIEQEGFNVPVTNDKQMQFQQNMSGRHLGVVVLPTNMRLRVFALISEIAVAISNVEKGAFLRLAPNMPLGRMPTKPT